MADENDLTRYVTLNTFEPLTPEQRAFIDRDKINESLGPFDFMPGGMTALGAGIGTGLGALLPGGLRSIPHMARQNRRFGEYSYPTLSAIKDALTQTAAVGGGTAALQYPYEIMQRVFDRQRREEEMLFGNPADAEGQPGGFYGKK